MNYRLKQSIIFLSEMKCIHRIIQNTEKMINLGTVTKHVLKCIVYSLLWE